MRIILGCRRVVGITVISIEFGCFDLANGLDVFLRGVVEVDDNCFSVCCGFFSLECFIVEGVCDDARAERTAS